MQPAPALVRGGETTAAAAEEHPVGDMVQTVPGEGEGQADLDGKVPPPQRAGLLAEPLPSEGAALDSAIRLLCERLDDIGQDLSHVLARNGLLPWVLALTLGATTFEATRRCMRRSRSSLAFAGGTDEDTLTWVPDLSLSLNGEEI